MENLGVSNRTQYGEEKLLREILENINFPKAVSEKQYIVEFGAWDGRHLCNTRFLAEEGYPVLWIEPDRKRFKKLQKTIYEINNKFSPVKSYAINSYISSLPDQTLDHVLNSYVNLEDVSILLMSVDIDGSDLQAFCTLSSRHQPVVVVIEYNYFMHENFVFLNPKSENIGSSGRALVLAFSSMGYVLCGQTLSNLIFIKSDYTNEKVNEVALQTAVNLFFSYDGELHMRYSPSFKRMYGWLEAFKDSPFLIWPLTWGLVHQPVPRIWRKWPRNQLLLGIYLNLKAGLFHPLSALRLILSFIRRRK